MNKRKLINDPVYGFISIPGDLIYDIIGHPFFQRLRRIKQLGLTDFVYPGANHTRFHHALGAMHLMGITLDNLRGKGHFIYDSEQEAASLAILMHDIGHGPFSHTLESTLLKGIKHEELSVAIINHLNQELNGQLEFALQIFRNKYPRQFFHQLVSSQLDMDRLDYLKRDSFFTGVYEGIIGAERIIKMINVVDDHLVVEEKGIYSIENFLSARRLMYWQVYLHKTTICAEKMLIKAVERAKYLTRSKGLRSASENMDAFLLNDHSLQDFLANGELLERYCSLDDTDIWASLKIWQKNDDPILSKLCRDLLQRRLFKILLLNTEPSGETLQKLRQNISKTLDVNINDASYYLASGTVSNAAYIPEGQINILTKSGKVIDVAEATDLPNIQAMKTIVTKHYVCWPREVSFEL